MPTAGSHSADPSSPYRASGTRAPRRQRSSGGAAPRRGVEGAADGPDEAEQLARDRGDDLRLELAPRGEPAVAVTEAELRLPSDGADRVGQADLAAAERAGTTGAMAIGPGRLDQHAPQMRVADLDDRAPADPVAGRVFAGDGTAVGHELARMGEPGERPDLTHDGGGRQDRKSTRLNSSHVK